MLTCTLVRDYGWSCEVLHATEMSSLPAVSPGDKTLVRPKIACVVYALLP